MNVTARCFYTPSLDHAVAFDSIVKDQVVGPSRTRRNRDDRFTFALYDHRSLRIVGRFCANVFNSISPVVSKVVEPKAVSLKVDDFL